MGKVTLKELRKERDLTLQQLSDLSGITKTEISFLEKGKTKPRPQSIQKLANSFNLTYEEMFDIFYS